MKCVAVILSGGTGSRMNMDIPKQYIEVEDRMIITESIRSFIECRLVSDIRIVADGMWHEKILDEYRVLSRTYLGECNLGMDESLMAQSEIEDASYQGLYEDALNHGKEQYTDVQNIDVITEGIYKFSGFSLPGENRQLSILNALRDIESGCKDKDIVIIHDAARPLISVDMIERCIMAVDGHDGVMPVLPMKDTVYYSEDGKGVTELLNRDKIFAGQAPEVFRVKKYLNACEALLPDKIMDIRGSTEPAIMADMDIVMIPGDEKNFKITTQADLERYWKYRASLKN